MICRSLFPYQWFVHSVVLIILLFYVWPFGTHICLCTLCMHCPQRPEEGFRSHGTEITEVGKNKTQVPCRSSQCTRPLGLVSSPPQPRDYLQTPHTCLFYLTPNPGPCVHILLVQPSTSSVEVFFLLELIEVLALGASISISARSSSLPGPRTCGF